MQLKARCARLLIAHVPSVCIPIAAAVLLSFLLHVGLSRAVIEIFTSASMLYSCRSDLRRTHERSIIIYIAFIRQTGSLLGAATNVIHIVVDDLGRADLGFRNNQTHTPTLDKFATEGLNSYTRVNTQHRYLDYIFAHVRK